MRPSNVEGLKVVVLDMLFILHDYCHVHFSQQKKKKKCFCRFRRAPKKKKKKMKIELKLTAKEMSATESETSDTMCLDDDGSTQDRVQELMTQAGNKSPDQVYNIVSKWGKGTECVIEWGFRQNTTNYKSNGIVVGRTVRKSTVKVKISYEPALGHDGPCGFLYLPPSNKIRICNLQATKLFKIEMPTQNLEEQAEHISCEDGQSDLDPLPPMAQIDPSFAVHVVAIFRAIIRGYAAAELDSEKEAIWHKFLNAPRDSLATVRQAIRRNQKVAHVRNDRENLEASNLSAEQRAELEIDRRSIRHALQTARAGNLGKATLSVPCCCFYFYFYSYEHAKRRTNYEEGINAR